MCKVICFACWLTLRIYINYVRNKPFYSPLPYVTVRLFLVYTGLFFGLTMVMVSVVLVMAVITTNLYSRKDSAQGPPLWMVNLVVKFYPEMMPPKEVLGNSIRRKERRWNGRPNDIASISDQAAELDSLTVTCTSPRQSKGCCCSHDVEYVRPDQVDMDRIDAEWRMVSRFFDRLFFWIYLVLSSVVQVVLFMNMTP